ncbi:FAD binding domain-containing protein [Nocardioides sp. 31GB23]|uniref:FAD binding domain-containing protein n=1 Tax=Nocardioides sp. 31GB23 TaxID=3156065 RepID=UPI0032AEBBEE
MDLTTVTSYRLAHGRDDLVLAPGEAFVAGGTWLFSEPQPDLTGLVDLTALGWPDTEPQPGGGLRISATCPVSVVRDLGPALFRDCADALLMSWKIQHEATVGGNLVLALPAGGIISLAAGLAGEVVLWTPDGGERREPVTAFVRGAGLTGLRRGEVLRAVDLPGPALAAPAAYRRAALAPRGRSGVVVVGLRDPRGVRVTITAATTRPVVVRSLAEVAAVDCWYDDVHGAPDWRAAVTARLVAEVLEELS